MEQVLFKPSEKQQRFISAALSGKYLYLMFGGAIRGGKTFVVLGIIILLCKIFPGSRWVVVRKNLPVLRRNTIPTFEKIAPRPFCGPVRGGQSDFLVRCQNGSEILFFPESVTQDPEYNRWKGLEFNGCVLEEANEMQEGSFAKAQERAGSWHVPGLAKQPPILVLLTCNPAQNWVKKLFYDPFVRGELREPFFYLPATIKDNPHLSPEYVKSLENLPEHLYRMFVLGDWTVQDDPMQIIPYEQLHARLIDETNILDEAELEGTASMGIDVAELGVDNNVFTYQAGNVLYRCEGFEGQLRTDQVVTLAAHRIAQERIPPERVGVDAVGVGAGVWGGLVGMGMNVHRVIAGARPENLRTLSYAEKAAGMQITDLKTQMWWMFRNAVINPESPLRIINHGSLVQDLSAPRYKIVGERRIVVESKDELKKRLGRSNDYGESAVICHYMNARTFNPPAESPAPRGGMLNSRESSLYAKSIFNRR